MARRIMSQDNPKSLGVLIDTRLPVRGVFMYGQYSVEVWKPMLDGGVWNGLEVPPGPIVRIDDTGLWSTKIDPLVDDWRSAFRGEQES